MVTLKRESGKSSVARFFVRWMEKSHIEIEDQYQVVRESQRVLWDALLGVVGEAKSLTYQIEKGALVKLIAQEAEGVAIEWDGQSLDIMGVGSGESSASCTHLYEVCFPTQLSSESELQYQIRVLEGLDRFVDSLAFARLVAREA